MARINVRGVLIPNSYKWYYNYFEEESTCPEDVRKILDAAPNEVHDVVINSPGGVIETGSEIYTMLREYQPGVNIKIVGEACSAASVVAMAGRCEMSPTALMMVHCVSSGARGNHADMEHCAEMLRTADNALCQAYMAKAGMSREDALQMMEQETWLTAQQALERGLIDAILFEESTTEAMSAAVGFKLPTMEQLDKVRRTAGKEPAFSLPETQAKLNLLKLRGEIR